jgi:tRNA nucleotidyltransferase (CCA-adding enzyme)
MSAALVSGNPPTDGQVRAWVAAIGRLQIGHVMRLASGAWAAARARGEAAPPPRAVRWLYRRMLASALRDPIDLGALAVDGDDLRRAGIPPGPTLGRILQALLASVIVDPARNTPDWLLQEAQRLEREGHVASPPNAGHTDRR